MVACCLFDQQESFTQFSHETTHEPVNKNERITMGAILGDHVSVAEWATNRQHPIAIINLWLILWALWKDAQLIVGMIESNVTD
ncbi:hypothetical protein OUZ56_004102 [Daphnia magna]|uniref:Uncharacterized protein n=1 Tax=Daphnia magna TaxID=35525 RepID=A0ABQ9YNY1_9CRUS|nr:hypothetical protein OUZ56_004102 [Daphnia magna]